MVERLKLYLQKHFPFVSALASPTPVTALPKSEKANFSAGMKAVLLALQLLPWLCGLAFLLSFFPLFNTPFEARVPWLGMPLRFEGLLRTISVSGLIGYGTNYIAIHMLFRPLVRRPIWGQGLIPAQRDRIILRLAQGMHTHVLSQELIRKRVEETGLVKRINDLVADGTIGLLRDEEFRRELKGAFLQALEAYAAREEVRTEIKSIIDKKLEGQMDKGIRKLVLQTYKRYNREEYEAALDQLIGEIPELGAQVLTRSEAQLDRLAAWIRKEKRQGAERIMEVFVKLLNSIDITDLLAKQMSYLDERKLERMVWEATNEQLVYIQNLGTFLGILGGLLIWSPLLTLGFFAVIFALLFGLDVLLFRLQNHPRS